MLAVSERLLVILGPTASGKSAVAMTVAERVGAEILSVDSMQVYRGMDVGTSKPTAAERARVRHHLIDVAEPNESFTVARFVEQADVVIADCRRRGVPLIATGGAPLYYKSLFQGLFDGPATDPALRDRLAQLRGDELHRRLAAVDPPTAARLHPNDVRRLIRALEVYELTGTPISALQTAWAEPTQRHAAVWVGLAWDREAINGRINARAKTMMAVGWVAEAQLLLTRYGALSPTAGEATGYAEIFEHLRGRGSLEEAFEQIKIATRQLARKQMKWFRRFPGVAWLGGDQPVDVLADEAVRLWSSGSSGLASSGDNHASD